MMKTIYVPYDLSEQSKKALKNAIGLSKLFGSKIIVGHALEEDARLVDFGLKIEKEALTQSVKDCLDESLKGVLEDLSIEDIDIHFLFGSVIDELLIDINKSNADLVVMGTSGRTGLKHIVMGSVAESLVRRSPTPVLVVRRQDEKSFEKILVPVDFSDQTEEVLQFLGQIKQDDTQVELFHVVGLPDIAFYSPVVEDDVRHMTLDKLKDAALNKLHDLSSEHASLNAEVSVEVGPAAEEIVEKAKTGGFDLILIPTHGESGIKSFFLGSIAEAVIRYSSINVLSYASNAVRKQRASNLN